MKDIVCEVRNAFIELYNKSPELYDSRDLDKIKTNEFTVKRFVLYNNSDFDKSLKQLSEAMKWRKAENINDLTAKDIPLEFFLTGALYRAGKSKESSSVVYFRAKTILKNKKLESIMKLMSTYMMNKLDDELNGKPAILVVDMSDVSIKQSNLNLLQFVVHLFQKYYPLAITSIIIYNNPWYLRPLEAVVKAWLSATEQQLLRFASGDQLFRYIDEEDVRKYLFGENECQFLELPEECKPFSQLCDIYCLTGDEVNKVLKEYKHIIEDGIKLLKVSGYYLKPK